MDASGRPAPLSEGMVMNASGDKVCALDVQSDLIVEEELRACAAVSGYASEERRTFVPLNAETGRFVVVLRSSRWISKRACGGQRWCYLWHLQG